MEKIICGSGLSKPVNFDSKNSFIEASLFLQAGHEECGDSAFIYHDDEKVIVAVFDGVSGESGAAAASCDCATSMLGFLKNHNKIDKKKMEEAFVHSNKSIKFGFTTATIAFITKNGEFMLASVGDSPVYSINKGEAALEIPPARAVGNDHSILKFFHFRNLVSSVLGGNAEFELKISSGKLTGGEIVILASDGLSDNLFVLTNDGYILDSSGSSDLISIIGNIKSPSAITKKLASEISIRMKGTRIDKPNAILVPKKDDLSIISLLFI